MRLQKEIRFISSFRVINLNYMLKSIKILRKGCNWFVTTLRLINIYFPCLFGGDHTHGGPAASPYFAGSCVYAEVRKAGGRIGQSMTGACEGFYRHHHLATFAVFLRLPFCMSWLACVLIFMSFCSNISLERPSCSLSFLPLPSMPYFSSL